MCSGPSLLKRATVPHSSPIVRFAAPTNIQSAVLFQSSEDDAPVAQQENWFILNDKRSVAQLRGVSCSPGACVGFLQVLQFPPTVKKYD